MYEVLPAHGYEVRDEQIFTAYQIAEAFANKKVHLAEAGLGTGKTFAYLLSAIPYARYTKKPVVIACATPALQEQLAGPGGDIHKLGELIGMKIDARMAKDPHQYICDVKVEDNTMDLHGMAEEISEWAKETIHGERSEMPSIPDSIWKHVSWDLSNNNSSDIQKITQFTTLLNDGHTNLEIPFKASSKCINAICKWNEQTLQVIKGTHNNLNPDDQILTINGKSIIDYYNFLSSIIPHENTFLVNSRSCRYPYENYNLLSYNTLNQFAHTNTSSVKFTILRDNKPTEIIEPFSQYDGTLKFVDSFKTNTFYFTSKNVGVLILYSCPYDNNLKKLLFDFFSMVKANHTHKIILDLSQNMGGNSNIIIEFLKYINVDKYKGYHVLERKGNELICLQNRNTPIYNNRFLQYCYTGEIFCNIGNDTFSTSRMFATILKDNNIATLSGEPSGGMPSSYGAPNKFQLDKNSRCRISTRLFLRPNKILDYEQTLVPDISIKGADINSLLHYI